MYCFKIKKQVILSNTTVSGKEILNNALSKVVSKDNALEYASSKLTETMNNKEKFLCDNVLNIIKNALTAKESKKKNIEALSVPVESLNSTINTNTPSLMQKEKINIESLSAVQRLGNLAIGTWQEDTGKVVKKHARFISESQKVGLHQYFEFGYDENNNCKSVKILTRIIYFE